MSETLREIIVWIAVLTIVFLPFVLLILRLLPILKVQSQPERIVRAKIEKLEHDQSGFYNRITFEFLENSIKVEIAVSDDSGFFETFCVGDIGILTYKEAEGDINKDYRHRWVVKFEKY